MTRDPHYPEFGYYALPGHALDPTAVYEEIRVGEKLGLGSVWLSERLNTKNVEVLSGVAAALTTTMGIASGLMANMPLRNPLVTAGYGSTMATLTDHRFSLGVGRGVSGLARSTGTSLLDFTLMADYLNVVRRLWRGEIVTHDGPAGRFDQLSLGIEIDPVPPVIMGLQGDHTAYWAGRHCDGVVLNSLWSPQAVAHSVKQVRKGALDAGRDPASVTVWAIMVTACEVSEETMLNSIIRRMNTYLYVPGMFEALCAVNNWDPAPLASLRAHLAEIDNRTQSAHAGPVGDEATTRDLDVVRSFRDMFPQRWITEGNAVGSADECAAAARARFDAGADGVLFHGTHPADVAPLLGVWGKYRAGLSLRTAANPGR